MEEGEEEEGEKEGGRKELRDRDKKSFPKYSATPKGYPLLTQKTPHWLLIGSSC